MTRTRCMHISIVLGILIAGAPRLGAAQSLPSVAGGVSSLVTVSGDSADRLRLGNLDTRGASGDFLLRSVSSLMLPGRSGARQMTFHLVAPAFSSVTNSGVPSGENFGAMWAGKGINARLMAGVDGRVGPVRITLIPELVYSANEFFVYDAVNAPKLPATRRPYAAPWNVYPYSIDAPPRMGPGHVRRVAPGQSTVSLEAKSLLLGVTTENEWWGPGLRTAIVLSDNAEGFPRAFVRPSRPLATRAGNFNFRLTWGGLSESPWFDHNSLNDVRYWSAFAGTWSPLREPDLTIGIARAVFGPASGWADVAIRPFSFLASTGRPNARTIADSTFVPGSDQIFSLFGRWVFPGKGFEAYAEWARAEFPSSLRDILVDPGHSQGYTFGVQWAGSPRSAGRLRLQGEHSYLEQDPSFANRPLGSFYTSRSVIQGYTNRGKVLGAGMGQGSSGQFVAADWMGRKYSAGAFLTRTRFNNDAYFLLGFPYGRGNCQHDVTFGPGVRGSVRTPVGRLSALYSSVQRQNSFFQNPTECQSFANVIDVRNQTLQISATFGM